MNAGDDVHSRICEGYKEAGVSAGSGGCQHMSAGDMEEVRVVAVGAQTAVQAPAAGRARATSTSIAPSRTLDARCGRLGRARSLASV